MNEPQNGSLSLEDVVRRFADSEQALNEAREKLEALTAIEETQAAVAHGLRDASASTREFVDAARELVAEAEETQKIARAVLNAGAGLIDGTDMKGIQDGVSGLATAVNEGFQRIEKLLGEVQERDQRIAQLESELERRTAALSGRQLKKLGLEQH
jgi:ElaB/YqjD/DUF883 family membrane-anchored ribosome-binding protein